MTTWKGVEVGEAYIKERLESARERYMFLLKALGRAKIKELEPQTTGLTAAVQTMLAVINRLEAVLAESNDRAYAIRRRDSVLEDLGYLVAFGPDEVVPGTVEDTTEEAQVASERAADYGDRAIDQTDEPDDKTEGDEE